MIMNDEYNFFSLAAMTVFISFLGFLVEDLWLALTKGYIDNRNMRLPFLLGYGIAVMGMYVLFGTPDEIVILGKWKLEGDGKWFYYMLSVLLVSVGEILLGSFVRSVFGFDYWNYEWIPFHLTKYTSLPTSLLFGGLITLFMEHIFTPLMELFQDRESMMGNVLLLILLFACVLDFFVSFHTMHESRSLNERWRIERSADTGHRCHVGYVQK